MKALQTVLIAVGTVLGVLFAAIGVVEGAAFCGLIAFTGVLIAALRWLRAHPAPADETETEWERAIK